MPIQHAVLFCLAVAAIMFTITRWRAEPALALILGAAAFAVACGLSIGQLGKSFGNGFGAAAAGPGLAILAAAMIGAIAEAAGATRTLAQEAASRRRVVSATTPLLGLAAGLGASPAIAFAVLTPLATAGSADAVGLGLAVAAGQGLLLPSPVMIAATTILGADWRLVLAIGLPCALILAVAACRPWQRTSQAALPTEALRKTLPAAGLLTASAVLLALLIVQSLGDIPSEPFGGGSARELLLGVGRPTILLLTGTAIMAAAAFRAPLGAIAGTAMSRAAPLMLLLDAAGGLQSLAMDSRMADSLAEAIATWHAGLLAPFLVAACFKMLLGSSPVAAISAAGILQPALAGLGLDDPIGHACAALAVGAGAVAGSHVNDAFFWIVADQARMRPLAAMKRVFGGTLLLGAAAVALLWIVLAIAHA